MDSRLVWWCLLSLLPVLATPLQLHAEPVCAQVKIEIQQELTLERQAFDAMMRINNGLDGLPIENVRVTVSFRDEDGNSVLATSDPDDSAADFFIRIDALEGIADVGGTGSVAPRSIAEIHWLIIPSPGAARERPGGRLFTVGAHLSYTLGGTPESVDVAPDFIAVKPLPRLALDYFLTRDVIGDDPFTPEIEPGQPYTLGVRVKNNGSVAAEKLRIDTAQPRIVENVQGLLIGFDIIEGLLDDQPAAPLLLLDFGEVPGNGARVGRWRMLSSLSGEFTDFAARYTHADALGGEVTSLFESVASHSLVRDVRVDLPGRDRVRDFLALDGDVHRVYESGGGDADVADRSAGAALTEVATGADQREYELRFSPADGFSYVRLPDPSGGAGGVRSVVRSDGKRIPLDNAWISRTRNRDTTPPSWETHFNLFDVATTGVYRVAIGAPEEGPQSPVLQQIPDRGLAEGERFGFVVEASDPDGQVPSLDAGPLPSGASFTDRADGTALFDWPTRLGQAGAYLLKFRASDGVLATEQTVRLNVFPDRDRDGDGMDDAWEMQYFATLARNGSGDFDGDGSVDLQEFLDGTDPTRSPGPGVPLIAAPLDGTEVDTVAPLLELVNGLHNQNMTVSYQFEVYADPGLTLPVAVVTDIPESETGLTAWEVPPLLEDNTRYHWRGRAFDGATASAWVDGTFFVNLFNDPPGSATPAFPLDGAVVSSDRPTLQVTNGIDVDGDQTGYAFRVYGEADPVVPVAQALGLPEGSDGTTSWTVDVPLEEDGIYHWTVTVMDEHAMRTESVLSSFLVSTFDAAPSAPAMLSPADGQQLGAAEVTLVAGGAVDPEGGALVYRFEVDVVPTFDSDRGIRSEYIPAADGNAAFAVTGLIENARYHWRVKANDGGLDSPWTSGSFLVNAVNDPPPTPVPLGPGQRGWVGDLRPTLELAPLLDPDGDDVTFDFEVYSIRLNRWGDAGLSVRRLADAGQADGLTWTLPAPLRRAGWYAWRARATDQYGLAGPWTPFVFFYADDDGVNDRPDMVFIKVVSTIRAGDGDPTGFVPTDGYWEQDIPGVLIRWQAWDEDSDASVELYYADEPGRHDGRLIVAAPGGGQGNDQRHVWSTGDVAPGVYHLYGVVDDGTSSVIVDSPFPALVGDGGGAPFLRFRQRMPRRTGAGGERVWVSLNADDPGTLVLSWYSHDSDSDASVDLHYEGIDDPTAAGPIALGLRESERSWGDSFAWDVPVLEPGRYRIYGVVSDGTQSLRVDAVGIVVIQ